MGPVGVVCAFCGRPPSPHWREVVFWERDRGRQTEDRRETGRRICESCIEDVKSGVAPNTPRLFS
jgi:hypothetical protein